MWSVRWKEGAERRRDVETVNVERKGKGTWCCEGGAVAKK